MTPAVEAAKRAGIDLRLHDYDGVELGDGDYAVAVADALGRPPAALQDTRRLGRRRPARLRRPGRPAARPEGARQAAELADRAKAERATGYVVGGIGPLGQRRRLPTTVDASALDWATISSAPAAGACRWSWPRRT